MRAVPEEKGTALFLFSGYVFGVPILPLALYGHYGLKK